MPTPHVPGLPIGPRILIDLAHWGSELQLTWIDISGLTPPEHVMQFDAPYELRKMTASWARQPAGAGIAQDAAQCTFHFLNITDGDPDATWTTDDYVTVETNFDDFWTAAKVFFTDDIVLTELTWKADGPAFKPFGDDVSPTLRTVSRDFPGTGSGESLPPQCAMTVTEVTSAKFEVTDVAGHPGTQLRNRWGRFYLPPPAVSTVLNGRIDEGVCDSLSEYVETWYNSQIAGELIPVMYSPTTGSAWSIDEIHVDDIFDVIRSRRFEGPLTRAVAVLGD